MPSAASFTVPYSCLQKEKNIKKKMNQDRGKRVEY
jgi:hypothetical protein